MSRPPASDAEQRRRVTEAAQRAAGVIAARDRGDVAGAEELLGAFDDEAERTFGFYLLAELSLKLLAAETGESIAECAGALSLDISEAL